MSNARDPERIQTVVIGAGQAGLSVGYHLARRGLPFVILDANARVGDNWRKRWDSLRLFTPARYDGLAGMAFPGSPTAFPTKNEMADFLEAYATRFKLPIRSGVKVERLSRHGRGYLVSAGNQTIEADHVVVAMSNYQSPRVPPFSKDLDPGIRQIHSIDYRNPSQLQEGPVPRRRGRQLGRGNRDRGRAWPQGVDVGQGHRPGAVPSQQPHRPDDPGSSSPTRPFPPRSDGGHSDGSEGAPEGPFEGGAAHPDPVWRPGGRRRRADSTRVLGEGRQACTRRREGSRSQKRRLVHRVPSRLLLDRRSRVRRGRQTKAGARHGNRSARAVFRRPPLPLRVLVDHDSRGWPGRRPRRIDD